MISTKLLLTLTLAGIFMVYYMFLTPIKIFNIFCEEYITMSVTLTSAIVFLYYKRKLKGKEIFEFIPNSNYVSIKSSIIFFLLFEVVDYYTTDGFMGMISLWFTYWVFGLFAYFMTHNINFYKNYKTYQ